MTADVIGVYGTGSAVIVQALHQSGQTSFADLTQPSFRDAILSGVCRRFVVAPNSADDLNMAVAARSADASRVFIITGLAGQPAHDVQADLGPAIDASTIVPSITAFANGLHSTPAATPTPVPVATGPDPVSYTHLTLPTTPYV